MEKIKILIIVWIVFELFMFFNAAVIMGRPIDGSLLSNFVLAGWLLTCPSMIREIRVRIKQYIISRKARMSF